MNIPPAYVYIVTNKHNTTLYVGMTSQLLQRIDKHRNNVYPNSFSTRYNLRKLVYYEGHPSIISAIRREKQLKAGSRKQKVNLINRMNPAWKDLYSAILMKQQP